MFRLFVFVLGLVMGVVLVAGCVSEEGMAGTAVSAGDPAAGEVLFQTTCFACHGRDAAGLPGQGKDLTTSAFTRGLSDEEFVEFVKRGRDISDPMNTTGVDMPPYGGNPALSEQDLFDIVAFIRGLER